jgi:hypothetical protein
VKRHSQMIIPRRHDRLRAEALSAQFSVTKCPKAIDLVDEIAGQSPEVAWTGDLHLQYKSFLQHAL